MTKEEKLYNEAGEQIKSAEASQMFGKPCYKINGKAFMCFFEDCAVFKLESKDHETSIKLSGAELFDPSRKGRAMKEWVQVPYKHKDKWMPLAKSAAKYVAASMK
jgi:hypothetical protein